MLLPLTPTSDVLNAIRPLESSLSILLPILEVSFISSAISPGLYASPFHVAHSEFSFVILVQVSKVISSKALEVAVHKVTFIVRAVFPVESSLSILLAFVEIADVRGLRPSRLAPSLNTLPMLLVVLPVAFVLGVVYINEDSIAIGLVLLPAALVHISIGVSHSSSPIGFVSLPHSFVLRAIGPKLDAYAIAISIFLVPLPFVEFAITHILVLVNVDTLNSIILRIVLGLQLELP